MFILLTESKSDYQRDCNREDRPSKFSQKYFRQMRTGADGTDGRTDGGTDGRTDGRMSQYRTHKCSFCWPNPSQITKETVIAKIVLQNFPKSTLSILINTSTSYKYVRRTWWSRKFSRKFLQKFVKKIVFAHRSDVLARSGSRELRAVKIPIS